MKKIYILLTRSQTVVSKAIHRFTGDEYTHVSIAYDNELKSLCSFARINTAFPIPAGLVHEDLYEGYFALHRYIPCKLLELDVSDQTHEKVKNILNRMLSVRNIYRYNALGLVTCKMGIERQTHNSYFCSQFVAEVIEKSKAFRLPKTPSLMRPQDFSNVKELKCVYKGMISELMHDRIPLITTA